MRRICSQHRIALPWTFCALKGAKLPKALTKEQWLARAVAYEEAAEYLDLEWADEAEERAQGKIVRQRLLHEARLCRNRVVDLK